MTAPSVLLALVEAGVVLWVEDGRLRFRAPDGALTAEIRDGAARCGAALVALVEAGAVLPAGRDAWSVQLHERWEERAAVMEFEGGLVRELAEREAERWLRVVHARGFVARHALVVHPSGGAVASSPARGRARTGGP